ncbi:MAG: serine hydrolase [Bacteroidota bacterium]
MYKNNKKYKNEALGYAYINDEVKLSLDWDMSWAGGAGNLYSTADDLLQWNRKIFKGEIINKESLKKAHSKVKLNDGSDYPYGFGWGLGEYKGLKIIAHSGGLHGFLTNLAYYPEIDATIAVLSNCSPPKKIVPGNFTEKLADIFFEEHLTENQEVVVDVLKLHKYVGKYVYPGGAIMEITNENNQLMAQLTGQPKHPIYPKSENVFFWKIVDAEITFHTDEEGKVDYGMHKQNGFENKVPKYSEPEEVSFNPSDFEPFVGEYAMGPAVVNVWVENEVFYVQITGQPKFQIFPKSKTRFFLKAVQAEIEFNNSKTPAPAFTLFQGGNEVKAVRK